MPDTAQRPFVPATESGKVTPTGALSAPVAAHHERLDTVDLSVVHRTYRSGYRRELAEVAGLDLSSLSDEDLDTRVVEITTALRRDGLSHRAAALAVAGEVAARTLGMRPYLVQYLGAMIVSDGHVAEMATGEGKTLSAALAVAVGAMAGHRVHVMTANDYLAGRDAQALSDFYDRLGLSVGVIFEHGGFSARREAYQCDVVYGTAVRFGFDFLFDHMVMSREDQVQSAHDWAVVDEADALLIDEARVPLIISGEPFEAGERGHWATWAAGLVEEDYELDWTKGAAWLTESGIEGAERFAGVENLYEHPHLAEMASRALFAQTMMEKDRDYLIIGEGAEAVVAIVDEGTGRVMEGRRWQDGLHAAVEAKEGVTVRGERRTMASVTIPSYLGDYELVGGMSGTAKDAEDELAHLYDLKVLEVPPHRPRIRIDEPDALFVTLAEKFDAMTSDITEFLAAGRPVLIGAPTVVDAERISKHLRDVGVEHVVLSARDHEREAEVIAQAGRPGAVTVATNMAGRGVDILLGGDPRGRTDNEAAAMAADRERVLAAGGLVVMATARHTSKRIDNQLRGRSGRQGEPGTTKFYISFDDDLLSRFSSDSLAGAVGRIAKLTGGALRSKRVTNVVDDAQKRAEMGDIAQRQHLSKLDRIYQEQQREVYRFRDQILLRNWRENLAAWWDMANQVGALEDLLVGFSDADSADLLEFLNQGNAVGCVTGVDGDVDLEATVERDCAALSERMLFLEDEAMNFVLRALFLESLDASWRNQLTNLDALRDGIDLRRQVGDTVSQFGLEAFDMFQRMMARMGAIGIARVRANRLMVVDETA